MTSTPLSARAPRHRGARALFTGRAGGVSAGEFSSLNLARHVGDDPAAVEANRALLAAELDLDPASLVFVDQVHSAEVHVLPAEGPAPVVTADAIVTDRRDVAIAIMVADCLPVLLVDAEAGMIGAAHAGRPGLLGGVLEATVAAMRDLGARPERLTVSIGPSVCGACYEVPAEMWEAGATLLPAAAATTRWGTPALDLRAGAVQALTRLGVPAVAIDADHPCTLEDDTYFSYRRQGRTGRFAGIIARA